MGTNLFQTLIVIVFAFILGELLSFAPLIGGAARITVWIVGIIFIVNVWKKKI